MSSPANAGRGGALVRRPSNGGAIVKAPSNSLRVNRSATGGMAPWVQQIRTGLVGAGRQLMPLIGKPLAGAGAALAVSEGLFPRPAGDGTLSGAMRRGDHSRSPNRQMPGLRANARVPSQYPAGVPTGVGGGNAGASRQAPASPTPPRQQPPAVIFQAPAAPPPGRGNVARPVTGRSGRERAYTAMVQQAGLTPEQAAAAEARGNAAAERRRLGPLATAPLEGKLDPSQDEYWQQADIKAWASVPAHQGMVKRLKDRYGYTAPEERTQALIAGATQSQQGMDEATKVAFDSQQPLPQFLPQGRLKYNFDPGIDPGVMEEAFAGSAKEDLLNAYLERSRQAAAAQEASPQLSTDQLSAAWDWQPQEPAEAEPMRLPEADQVPNIWNAYKTLKKPLWPLQ